MTRLTQVAYTSRKAVKYLGIAIVAIIFLRIGLNAFKSYWRARHPLPPPPPTVAFGKLPPISFDEKIEKPEKKFLLQTVEGDLPKMPDQAKVFFVVALENRFLALEKTTALAHSLGFSASPEEIRDDLYRYQNQNLKTTLTINPLTKAFRYQYPYLEDQTLATLPMPSQEELISGGRSFLGKIGRETDLSPEEIKISFLTITPERVKPVSSLSEAHLARIDFFREKIDGKYPLYPQGERANISLLVSGDTRGNRQVVEADYTYFIIDREKSATYPIKSVSQAWEELGEGKYHLAKLTSSPPEETIAIRRIYLGYLDPHYPTNFLQPIYVFEGDYGFLGFIPAISIEWVSE